MCNIITLIGLRTSKKGHCPNQIIICQKLVQDNFKIEVVLVDTENQIVNMLTRSFVQNLLVKLRRRLIGW